MKLFFAATAALLLSATSVSAAESRTPEQTTAFLPSVYQHLLLTDPVEVVVDRTSALIDDATGTGVFTFTVRIISDADRIAHFPIRHENMRLLNSSGGIFASGEFTVIAACLHLEGVQRAAFAIERGTSLCVYVVYVRPPVTDRYAVEFMQLGWSDTEQSPKQNAPVRKQTAFIEVSEFSEQQTFAREKRDAQIEAILQRKLDALRTDAESE